MGGRGASSGKYKWKGAWHTYGDEYNTVLQYRNIKFIKSKAGPTTAPMETQTQGRIYVTVNQSNNLKSIVYFRGNGNRRKQIDLDHVHKVDGKKTQPHSHLGYVHDENSTRDLTKSEQRTVDRVFCIWQNKYRK